MYIDPNQWLNFDGILDGVFFGFQDGSVLQFESTVLPSGSAYADFASWIQCWSNGQLVYEI